MRVSAAGPFWPGPVHQADPDQLQTKSVVALQPVCARGTRDHVASASFRHSALSACGCQAYDAIAIPEGTGVVGTPTKIWSTNANLAAATAGLIAALCKATDCPGDPTTALWEPVLARRSELPGTQLTETDAVKGAVA